MKKLIFWSVLFVLGGSLMAVAQNSTAKAPTSIAGATKENPFVNSLGMKFVPVPGTKVLFGIWDTRVEDFEKFVAETGYDATSGTGGMNSFYKGKAGQFGATWKNPGFKQGEDHPVVGVSGQDAKAFCAWLTKKEQKEGKIGADQEYRLPTNAEWGTAVGKNAYSWGNQYPPPSGTRTGNYAGSEAVDADWPTDRHPIPGGYRDDYPRTSPVGSFPANEFGLLDMGGNVCNWCEEPGVFRGSSWRDHNPGDVASARRNHGAPVIYRDIGYGFRCVLVPGPSSP